jgi:hypothetical protein
MPGAASSAPTNADKGREKEKKMQILSCAQDDSVKLGNAKTGASIDVQSQSD